MRICIIGAGAIGGLLAVKLAGAGEAVSVIDRGAHLAAIRVNGLQLHWDDGSVLKAKVNACETAAEAGKQDLVVLAVKAYDLEAATKDIEDLLGPETMVMTVQNGIPWWYFETAGGSFEGKRMQSLDPAGILSDKIDADRIIGCVSYPAASLSAPGIIHHVEGIRFPLGELDGRETERAKLVSETLIRSGLKSRVLTDIRSELWLKAWGSLAFNPISVLTHATMAGICRCPETRQLAVTMMTEAQAIASKLGISFRHTIEERVIGAENVGEHKTSMLQDLEAGMPLETEALVGAILEMGRLTKTETPVIEAVYGMVKLRDEVRRGKGSDQAAAVKAA
ncbi:MAG: 2-dehydropantoate 2-reductase [Methyloceanibacter sp.]